MAFGSVESLLRAAESVPVWEAVLLDDLSDRGVEREASWEKMAGLWRAMASSGAAVGRSHSMKSASALCA